MTVFVCILVCDALSCSDVMHLPGGFVLVKHSATCDATTCASNACAVFVLNKHKICVYVFVCISACVSLGKVHLAVQT